MIVAGMKLTLRGVLMDVVMEHAKFYLYTLVYYFIGKGGDSSSILTNDAITESDS